MNIGKTIYQLRKSKSIKQWQLAEMIGISSTSLSLIEKGKQNPNQNTINSICEALDINIETLYIMTLDLSNTKAENQVRYKSVFPLIKTLMLEMFNEPN